MLWTVARQASLSRQEYWSGLPFPSPRDLPNAVTEPKSSPLQADSLPSELPGKPDSPLIVLIPVFMGTQRECQN